MDQSNAQSKSSSIAASILSLGLSIIGMTKITPNTWWHFVILIVAIIIMYILLFLLINFVSDIYEKHIKRVNYYTNLDNDFQNVKRLFDETMQLSHIKFNINDTYNNYVQLRINENISKISRLINCIEVNLNSKVIKKKNCSFTKSDLNNYKEMLKKINCNQE